MSIQGKEGKLKAFFNTEDVFLVLLIIAVGVGSFGLGRLSVISNSSLDKPSIEYFESDQVAVAAASIQSEVPETDVSKNYVASKNGTKYHLPWCGGASQIKEENKIWFSTKEEAEAQGYAPASNCKGI